VCNVATRGIVLSAFLLIGACASSPDVPSREVVPLPRSRPAAAHRVPQAEQQATREADLQDIMRGNTGEFARKWTLCKLLFAEGLAQRTDQPIEDILAATFAACSNQEEELKLSFVQRRIRPEVIEETIAKIRATDREQLTTRIIAARQRR
jgi:hypothetical protein